MCPGVRGLCSGAQRLCRIRGNVFVAGRAFFLLSLLFSKRVNLKSWFLGLSSFFISLFVYCYRARCSSHIISLIHSPPSERHTPYNAENHTRFPQLHHHQFHFAFCRRSTSTI